MLFFDSPRFPARNLLSRNIMTETENTSPSIEACCTKKGRPFLWFLSGVLLMTLAATAAFLYTFRADNFVSTPSADFGEVEELKQRVEALERQFNALVQLAPAQQAASNAIPIDQELKQLKEMVQGVEGRETLAAHKVVAAAFAFWDLRDEARRGAAFDVELAALREASDDPKVEELASRLAPYAAGGTATLAQLREDLKSVQKNAPPPPSSASETSSIIAKIKGFLAPLISVKPSRDMRFSEIERALQTGDASHALEAVKALPPELQASADSLQKRMEARADLDATLKTLSMHFMSVPSPRSTP